jgi:hypothetical protein
MRELQCYLCDMAKRLRVSDQQIGKKEIEVDELMPFLDAYELCKGEALLIADAGESPDFVCARANCEFVGIELTRVMRDPATSRWEGILERKEHMEYDEALEQLYFLIERKEDSRKRRYSLRVPETILILQLVDRPLNGFAHYIEGLQDDFRHHGFVEVWLADYSGREAYGDIELFGLFPPDIWGLHRRPQPDRKPFG